MQTGKKGKPSFLIQGTILAMAGILVRIIGLIYRIPMTNILGEEGIGVYSAAYQIYNIILLLSSYSLPLAVSKLVSAKMAVREYRNAYRIFCSAMVFALIVGTLACGICWFGADFFAQVVLNMPEAASAIKVLAPAIFVMALLGVLRGLFQGQGTMIPTALSQIFEQIVNAIVSVVAAYYLFQYGLNADKIHSTHIYANAYGAAGGTLGTLMGAVTALVFCGFVYLMYDRVIKRQIRRDQSTEWDSYADISKVLVMTILPVILSSVIYNISSLLDNSMFGHYVEAAGEMDSYKSVWGAFSGKYLVMVHVPVAIATSLASSVIPTLSKAMARRDHGAAIDSIDQIIRFTMLIAIPSAVGLAVLAEPIMMVLFRGKNVAAINMMTWGSSAVVFFSLSTVTNGVLQGIGHMKQPIINAALSLVLHTVLLAAMLWGFNMGIYGVVAANIIFGASMCVLNALSIRKIMNFQQEIKKTFLLPLACSGAMGVAVWGLYQLIHMAIDSQLIPMVISIVVGMFLYFVLLLVLKCMDEEELARMPFGRTLASFGKKLHLL
ncbi:MAG: polysaccharide biosynthesis protein [Lachnospiraceae bacterium]|nr:polysaccharide biosynthesis protein [Lachnospiraceae bacterium]